MWHKPSAEISHLKSQCETFLEDWEDELENWYFKHQDTVSLQDYLCKDRYLKGKSKKCLKEGIKTDKTKSKGEKSELWIKTFLHCLYNLFMASIHEIVKKHIYFAYSANYGAWQLDWFETEISWNYVVKRYIICLKNQRPFLSFQYCRLYSFSISEFSSFSKTIVLFTK